jgi:CBS domain-containing protein
MREIVPTVHPETPLPEVLQAVVSTRLNRAIVVDARDRLVGIVDRADILRTLVEPLR